MKVKPVGPSVCFGCDMGFRSGLIQQLIIIEKSKHKIKDQIGPTWLINGFLEILS